MSRIAGRLRPAGLRPERGPVHFERKMTVADDRDFKMLDAILDGPFAICSIITDAEGRPADYRFLRVSQCFEDTTAYSV